MMRMISVNHKLFVCLFNLGFRPSDMSAHMEAGVKSLNHNLLCHLHFFQHEICDSLLNNIHICKKSLNSEFYSKPEIMLRDRS